MVEEFSPYRIIGINCSNQAQKPNKVHEHIPYLRNHINLLNDESNSDETFALIPRLKLIIEIKRTMGHLCVACTEFRRMCFSFVKRRIGKYRTCMGKDKGQGTK